MPRNAISQARKLAAENYARQIELVDKIEYAQGIIDTANKELRALALNSAYLLTFFDDVAEAA